MQLKTKRLLLSLFLAPVLFAASLTAGSANEPETDLFGSDDNLEVAITAPWEELQRNEEYQGAYPATIEFRAPDGSVRTLPLTVERRGVKRQEACRFPPIKLRFEKDDVKGSLFQGEKSLKLVTHCQDADRYDQYYIIEMMAYRMYNQVTDYSFRVRPLTVNYIDADTGNEEPGRFAFVIEDDSDVAKRNGLKKLEIPRVSTAQLDPQTASEFALFQLMIANVDWSPLIGPDPEECCHNTKLIAPRPLEADDLIQPVPYDFDTSGLVDAPYAYPPANLGIRSVTQRLYRGYCAHNETLPTARQLYRDRQSDIMAVLDSDPRLAERSKKKASRFLEKFFEILEDDKDFERQVLRKCRK
jgi:hypothetical protein